MGRVPPDREGPVPGQEPGGPGDLRHRPGRQRAEAPDPTAGLTYKPFELADGAQELLDEVASSKITGEEERYSHIDLLDFQANDEGAEQAFADLQPGLAKIDPALSSTISDAFTALDKLVDGYRTGGNPSGFALYSALTDADKQKLAAAVKAVQEPLSTVAAKVSAS